MNKTLWTGLTCLGVYFLFETKGHCTPSLKFSHVGLVFFCLPIKMDAKTQEIEPGLFFFFFFFFFKWASFGGSVQT